MLVAVETGGVGEGGGVEREGRLLRIGRQRGGRRHEAAEMYSQEVRVALD